MRIDNFIYSKLNSLKIVKIVKVFKFLTYIFFSTIIENIKYSLLIIKMYSKKALFT